MINCDKCGRKTDERAMQSRMGFWVCTDCDQNTSDSEFADAMGLECMVMLHGFTNLDENNMPCRETGLPVVTQEHSDSEIDECDGFSVWVRIETPHDKQQPFDMVESTDKDFATIEAAREYAESLSHEWGNSEIDEY